MMGVFTKYFVWCGLLQMIQNKNMKTQNIRSTYCRGTPKTEQKKYDQRMISARVDSDKLST
jgi:hypothetical protein